MPCRSSRRQPQTHLPHRAPRRRPAVARAAAALAFALCGSAAAAQGVLDWDADGDSYLNPEEFAVAYQDHAVFDSYDANADGVLDAQEGIAVTYAMMDLDGDGVLAVEEWERWAEQRLGAAAAGLSAAAWDRDGDGTISREEWAAEAGPLAWDAEFDRDANGLYDRDEFAAALWDFSDTDGDGRLSAEEAWLRRGR